MKKLYLLSLTSLFNLSLTSFNFLLFQYMQSSFFYNKGYHAVSEVVVSPWDTGYIAEDYRKLYIKDESRIIVPHLADFLSVGSVVEQIGVVSVVLLCKLSLSYIKLWCRV